MTHHPAPLLALTAAIQHLKQTHIAGHTLVYAELGGGSERKLMPCMYMGLGSCKYMHVHDYTHMCLCVCICTCIFEHVSIHGSFLQP